MTKERNADTPKSKFVLRSTDWAILPLGILTVYGWYRVFATPINFRLQYFGGMWYHGTLLYPSVVILAIALFGSLYIYRDIRRKDVGKYARVVAYIFACLVILYALIQLSALTNGPDTACSAFFGVRTRCAEVTQLQFSMYLLNPVSLFLWGVLGTIGSVVLLQKIRLERSTG